MKINIPASLRRGVALCLVGGLGFSQLCLGPSAIAADNPSLPEISVHQAVSMALAGHPSLHQMQANENQAEAQTRASRVLQANPTVSGWFTPGFERATLSIMQPVSITGEGAYVRRSASKLASSISLARDRERLVVAAETWQAYVQAVVAANLVDVAQEGIEISERMVYATQRRFEEGEASKLDVRLARLAQGQAGLRLLQAQQEHARTLQTLATWTLSPAIPMRSARVTIPQPTSLAIDTQRHRGDLAAAELALAAAAVERSSQRAAAIGPLTIGLQVEVEGPDQVVGPALSVPIPLFNRNQVGKSASSGTVRVQQANLMQTTAKVEVEQRTTKDLAREAMAIKDLIGDDLLQDAKASLVSIEAGVLAGEIDLPTALLLQRQVLDGEGALVQLDGRIQIAKLQWLLAHDDTALLLEAQ